MKGIVTRSRIVKVLFGVYGLALLYLSVFRNLAFMLNNLEIGRNLLSHIRYHVNFIPFDTYNTYYDRLMSSTINVDTVVSVVCSNLLVLIPLGFLCRMCLNMPFGKTMLTALLTAVVLDMIQLLTMTGSFDVDIILLRMVGACAGWLVGCIIGGAVKMIRERLKPEPAVLLQ
ncbi:MAG: VanZ family protein [Clostridia bacterium]|nr:VanZ family protein [Clostridia bacterium]MBQ8512297.1 VanZ family protein [Clostridia bacterium]